MADRSTLIESVHSSVSHTSCFTAWTPRRSRLSLWRTPSDGRAIGSNVCADLHAQLAGVFFADAKEIARPKPGFDGVPNDAELEPSGGVPHRLGGATEDGGVRATSAYAPRALYDAIASSSAVRMGVYAMPSSLSALLPSN